VDQNRTRNDLGAALVRFCVAIEEHRRTPEGRVRTPAQFLAHFFSTDSAPKDEVFRHMPKEVRGPILSSWGIRGAKAALRDDDDKVVTVVSDALAAGDLDADAFESALDAQKLLAWVPLASFWSFWRAGAINKPALLNAFTRAYELKLLDARAFLEALKARGGELAGTDVLGASFTKDDLVEWVRRIHAAGDGSPKGILEAAGWEKIVQKAPTEALLGALDALAAKLGLADAQPQPETAKTEAVAVVSTSPAETPAGAEVAIETSTSENASKTDPPPAEEEEIVVQPTDLAKTGPYAAPPPPRSKRPMTDEEEDEAEETKLYRQRTPLQRR
jgi:hypothetical protein